MATQIFQSIALAHNESARQRSSSTLCQACHSTTAGSGQKSRHLLEMPAKCLRAGSESSDPCSALFSKADLNLSGRRSGPVWFSPSGTSEMPTKAQPRLILRLMTRTRITTTPRRARRKKDERRRNRWRSLEAGASSSSASSTRATRTEADLKMTSSAGSIGFAAALTRTATRRGALRKRCDTAHWEQGGLRCVSSLSIQCLD